jgi:CubicO group peptidase (beta-lactamase class C family)
MRARMAGAMIVLAVALVAGCASSRKAGVAILDRDATAAELEAIRAGRAGAEVPGIAVARVNGPGDVETLAVGCAQFEEDGVRCRVPLTPDGMARIASISKLVVAISVMRLVDRGSLSLDRDVSDYLGFRLRNPAFPQTPITLRALLSHTSSLRDGETYWAVYPQTLAELLTDASYFDSSHPPGEFFTYANLNYGIAGTVIECAARERFDRYTHAVLAGYGARAAFNWSGLESLPPDRVVTLYRKQDAQGAWNSSGPWISQVDDFAGRSPQAQMRSAAGFAPPPVDYEPCSNGTLFAPQGGLRISIRDLARLVQGAMRDGSLARIAEPVWEYKPERDAGRAKNGEVHASDGDAGRELGNGDTTNGLYRAYGPGAHRNLLGAGLIGHFGDAYGLKGGVLVDLKQQRAWIYLITGASREPELAQGAYEGLDTTEAAVLKALGLP